MAAIATKIAVHAPCVETAFNPMETPSILEPVTNIQYAKGQRNLLCLYLIGNYIQRQNAIDRIPRPIWPHIKYPASSMPYTSRW